ncbi:MULTISPECIES: DNA repair protein RecO [Psychrilyobacter]|uniref:DNA repair protein RecO n=1 Tax=Psychrilyobacter piezotolerans TaxID=2293438 RepID=A0ABX9KLX0_9FUSO|nr:MULTISPECIES: DNA repair protein RecO [Psychrilyobacter]MCS5421053.1 DNA repair protein RecO [Psychrilyobacter sp. S5]NDI76332.1 DNA repair protein RecO [Psychrilyobacter piezotolerans]RDE65930.1 DNA repair protein RecO [Psychrilyobacter sp. S5]REI43108.1 DNA repair protein RecO [Psychrilyobacter piezotolerans]
MKLLKTDGIVIKKIDHSEADRSLTLFTKNFGKINLNISGIRKSKKRHLNGADLLGISNFIFYKKDDYYILSSFELNETFFNLRKDLEKLNISFHILEILNSILVENETRIGLYKLLLNSFRFLDKNNKPIKDYLLLGYFLALLIKGEGIMFNIKDGLYFDIENSIIDNVPTSNRLTEIQKIMIIHLFDEKINDIVSLDPSIDDVKNIISLLEDYMNYHLNLKINFKEFF